MLKRIWMPFMALSVLGSIIGCSSDNAESNEVPQSKVVTKSGSLVNPLEFIGIEHNRVLAKAMSNMEARFINGEFQNVAFGSSDYNTMIAKISDETVIALYDNQPSVQASFEQLYGDLQVNEWYDKDKVSEYDLAINALDTYATAKDKQYTTALMNDVYEAIDENPDNDAAFKALEAVIAKHEEIILSQDWSEGEDFALGALAVAKHSTIFWKNYDTTTFAKKPKNPRSAIIVGADMVGYVGGAIVGGSAGSFLGPAGTVGGVLGGKAAGAWYSSIAAGGAIMLYDAFSDFFGS